MTKLVVAVGNGDVSLNSPGRFMSLEAATENPVDVTPAAEVVTASPPTAPAEVAAPAAAPAQSVPTAVAPQPAYTLPPEIAAQLGEFNTLRQKHEQMLSQRGQLEQLAAIGQQVQRERAEAERKAAAEAAKKPLFDLPKFDQNLAKFIQRNPATGELEAKPGAPPDALAQFTNFQDKYAQAQLNFFQNPEQYLEGLVERKAREIAEAQVQQHLGGYQDKLYADSFLAQNRDWIVGADGRFTPEGQAFAGHVQAMAALGVTDSRKQAHYAKMAVERDAAFAEIARLRGQQPAAPKADPKAAFLATAAGHVPPAPLVPASPAGQPPLPAGASLAEQMRRDLAAAGITDHDIVT